jgi:tetratricopeptide (TPR) repeat protein
MFKRPAIFWLLCCTALLNACAHSPSNFWHTSTEQLIKQHHYQSAIEQINAEAPLNKALLKKVKSLAEQQRKTKIAKITVLIKQKKWGEARSILERLKTNQPNYTLFTAVDLQINKAQSEEERIINTQQALLEAQLLAMQFIQKDLSNRIHHNAINWFSINDDLKAQKQQLAKKLLRLSTQALLAKDYKNAQKAYKKAIELDLTLGTGKIKEAINSGLSHQNNKAINERRISLITQLTSAIATQNFESVLEIQEILSHEPFRGDDVEKILDKAKKTRLEHARKLDESATKEYRNGNISLAVTQWQQALLLTPTSIRIQERLIRARKVQRKLKKLTTAEEP